MYGNITAYSDMMTSSIRGKYDPRLMKYLDREPDKKEPRCGAVIRNKFNNLLASEYADDITNVLSDEDINKTLRDLEGDALPGFPSPDTFEMLIAPHLQKIEAPCLEVLNDIAQQLTSLAHRTSLMVFDRFPALAEKVFHVANNIVENERTKTKVIVENLVASQCGYLFTNDQDYLTSHGLMQSADTRKESALPAQTETLPAQPTHFQKVTNTVQGVGNQVKGLFDDGTQRRPPEVSYSGNFIGEIRKRLDAYFKLVVRNLRDSVPKAIGYNLIRQVQNTLAYSLHQHLANPGNLMCESPHIAEERNAMSAQLEILEKAAIVLSRDLELSLGVNVDAHLEEKYASLLDGKPSTSGAFPFVNGGSKTQKSTGPAPASLFGAAQPAAPKASSSLFGSANDTKKAGLFSSSRNNPLFD